MSSTVMKQNAGRYALIDNELCGICQACATVCPVHAIDVYEHYVRVLPDKCTGCGTCLKVCPVGAISLVEQ